MKFTVFSVLFLLCFEMLLQAQTKETQQPTTTKVLVDEKDLPADLLLRIKTNQKLEAYSEQAKWGHEIGIAVNETLTAVTDQTAKFSKTDVGRLAMFLVAWKIMAKDILSAGNLGMHWLVGIPLLVFGSIVVIWSYRRQCMVRPVVIERGPGLFFWSSKKYEIHDPNKAGGKLDLEEWVVVHGIAWGVILVLGLGTIFSG